MNTQESLQIQIANLLPFFADTPIAEIAVKFTHEPTSPITSILFELFSCLEAVNGCVCRLLAQADNSRDALESYKLIREVVINVAQQIPRVGELILTAKYEGRKMPSSTISEHRRDQVDR